MKPFPASVRVVLVQPESPGNVGAAARALQTMGLRELVLVAPQCDPSADEALRLAHSAGDLVRAARVVSTLEEALADTVVSVGTSRRTRRVGYPISLPEEAASLVRDRSAGGFPAAIVFGRESSGLDNAELALCSIQSTIPCATEDHSLNLAQAVQVYCYALYRAAPAVAPPRRRPATHAEWQHFYDHLARTLLRLGTRPATTMDNYIARFRRVLGRVPLESRDVRLLHKLLSGIDARMGRGDAEPPA